MKVAISSGHGKHIRGASSVYGDEVDEARKVVEQVATDLRSVGVEVWTFHDDVSDDQSENLNRIVNWHNARPAHDLDVSVHFNAYEVTTRPMGSEVLYVSSAGQAKADEIVDAICDASGLTNRGPKKRTDLAFLNGTREVAVLIETCFIDSKWDMDTYREKFADICGAISEAISGIDAGTDPGPAPPERPRLFYAMGMMSTFGGPDDTGVGPDEGLAFWNSAEEMREHDAGDYIMSEARAGAPGLARRLVPEKHYVACRWDYDVTSKAFLRDAVATVSAGGTTIRGVRPMDWGPHEDTGRVADLSPGLAEALGLDTDDTCEVTIYDTSADAVA